MGAHHSHADSSCIAVSNGRKGGAAAPDYIVKPSKKGSSQGKPSPPSHPVAQEVTHNSVTLTWLPPRHAGSTIFAYTVEITSPGKAKDKQWVKVTQACQGNSYQVKNLTPNTEYLFRVRAENIHGVSKASSPSPVVQTKMYELEDKGYSVPSPEDSKAKNSGARRRHSFNLHLESTVTTILNHTDIEVKPKVAPSPSEAEREQARKSTLQREAAARSSLQPNRKRSLPILLPGTKTNSMLKLRDSHTLPNIKSSAGDSSDSLDRRRNTGSRVRAGSRSGSEGKLDETDSKRRSRESSTDDDPKDTSLDASKEGSQRDSCLLASSDGSKQGSNETLDSSDPWERDESVSGVSDRIMTAPLCDDMNIALYSRSLPDETSSTWISRNMHENGKAPSNEGQADFRTLRSLLHSDDIIVKPTRSLPDVTGSNGVKKLSLPRNNNNNNNYSKLSTIVDLEDEDEDSVRITTL